MIRNLFERFLKAVLSVAILLVALPLSAQAQYSVKLKLIDDKTYRTVEADARCTKQDICADDDLLYFILWDGKHKDMDDFQNRVTIYDWNGEYRGVLEFNLGPEEPENISILGGEIYAVVSNKREPAIYHFEPKIK